MNIYKILFYNVENLFLSLEKYRGEDLKSDLKIMDEEEWQKLRLSLIPNKPLQKTHLLAQTILHADPEVVLMCEVGGRDSLANFNKYFLNDHYEIYNEDSNSSRGIDLGILIKKDLGIKVVSKNFLTYKRHGKKNKFNRNVLFLQTKKDDKPWINFFVVHLKSKLDKEKKDFHGLDARSMEIQGLVKILKKEMENNAPTILAGDFNGNASLYNTDYEFKPLYESDLNIKDALEVAEVKIDERVTHHYFKGHYCRGTQLDYLFLSQNLWDKVVKKSTKVLRYQNEFGEVIDPPQSYKQKNDYPSDHNPLLVHLKF